jgi:hypothetical protein
MTDACVIVHVPLQYVHWDRWLGKRVNQNSSTTVCGLIQGPGAKYDWSAEAETLSCGRRLRTFLSHLPSRLRPTEDTTLYILSLAGFGRLGESVRITLLGNKESYGPARW